MNIEENIKRLLKRLMFLGYKPFQIRNIVSEAVGEQPWMKKSRRQNARVMKTLQKYEKLGNEFLVSFSK